MSKYRSRLPQLSGELFLTDGGIETTLIFHEGFDLPQFAAFDVLRSDRGVETLRDYYGRYLDIATRNAVGFVLESPTWRASTDWGAKIGYSSEALEEVNNAAIELLREIRADRETGATPIVISGCMGSSGDGYAVSDAMSVEEAERYHYTQVKTLTMAGVDMVSAFTMTYADEAAGLARAARAIGVPVVIGFTVETDGRLPSGQPLGEAITAVDEITQNGPVYYMVNCAHPTHFLDALDPGEPWSRRIRAVRANASMKSHAELDEATELDDGDIGDLARQYGRLRDKLPNLNVLGGCCGTDHRHIEEICKAFIGR
jgi:S-methylmethionine-dependent homocysteine/selenocysteine methylase